MLCWIESKVECFVGLRLYSIFDIKNLNVESFIFHIRHSKFKCWIEFYIQSFRCSTFKIECWIEFDIRYLIFRKLNVGLSLIFDIKNI